MCFKGAFVLCRMLVDLSDIRRAPVGYARFRRSSRLGWLLCVLLVNTEPSSCQDTFLQKSIVNPKNAPISLRGKRIPEYSSTHLWLCYTSDGRSGRARSGSQPHLSLLSPNHSWVGIELSTQVSFLLYRRDRGDCIRNSSSSCACRRQPAANQPARGLPRPVWKGDRKAGTSYIQNRSIDQSVNQTENSNPHIARSDILASSVVAGVCLMKGYIFTQSSLKGPGSGMSPDHVIFFRFGVTSSNKSADY